MLIIDEPGVPEKADVSYWQRIRNALRCDHPEGCNVNPPAPKNIRPAIPPAAPPPRP